MVLICYKQVDNSVKIWWLVSFVIKLFVNNKKLPVSVLTEPPYVVKEQGYAGFLINVDIYFKGLPDNDAGKKVSFFLVLLSMSSSLEMTLSHLVAMTQVGWCDYEKKLFDPVLQLFVGKWPLKKISSAAEVCSSFFNLNLPTKKWRQIRVIVFSSKEF